MRKAILIIGFSCLSACGGGGGGSGDTCQSVGCVNPEPGSLVDPSPFLGTYNIDYRLSSNNCSGTAPLGSLKEQYNVDSGTGFRGIETFEVLSSNGISYQSYSVKENTDGKTFFRVTESQGGSHSLPNFSAGSSCQESLSLVFQVAGRAANARRTSDILCSSNDSGQQVSCKVVYEGNGIFNPETTGLSN